MDFIWEMVSYNGWVWYGMLKRNCGSGFFGIVDEFDMQAGRRGAS